MDIQEFVSRFRNHPVLFLGTGVSLRYLESSFTWDGLLKKVAEDLTGNYERYLDIKSHCALEGGYDFMKIATQLETEFNLALEDDRNGKFKQINDVFYEEMEKGISCSRFKLYLAKLLSDLSLKQSMSEEIKELKKASKNIASVITTNYDSLIEEEFGFQPLVGNDILLSNPYGSVYKIHGCITDPKKIIVTEQDYQDFDEKYELIRAQLLSIFIHNPIIFIGYSIGDENIKSLLKTIFTYVEPNSDEARIIRDNFLLVEREENSNSLTISEHDIVLEGFSTIRINKIKTDDFRSIYLALSGLKLPVSAMDVRKVQDIVQEIYAGGRIEVNISEDLESLENKDKIIAIGSSKTVKYLYQTPAGIMSAYFRIIEEADSQLLSLIDRMSIPKTNFFPVYGFGQIYPEMKDIEIKKQYQKDKVENFANRANQNIQSEHASIQAILDDENITKSKKDQAIVWSLLNDKLNLDEVELHLKEYNQKNATPYRQLLCAYDLKRYG